MGEALGEGGGGFVELGLGRRLAGELAEDRVDHAGGVGVAGGSDQLDGFREGGVGGDPIQVLELEGSHAEGGGDGGGEGLVGALEEGVHPGVEGDLPAEDAEDQGGGEVAVGLGEGGHAGAVEKVVGVGGGVGDAEKDGEGGGAGGGDGGVRGRLSLCRTLRGMAFLCRVLHRGTGSTRVRSCGFWHVEKGGSVEKGCGWWPFDFKSYFEGLTRIYACIWMKLLDCVLFQVFVWLELEVSGELGAGETGLAFELDFVEGEDRVFGGSDEEVAGGNVELIGLQS